MGLSDLLRKPLSFFGTRSSTQDRVAAYLVREHERGRSVDEILADPYVTNRCSDEQKSRLLERPEVIRALGDDPLTPVSTSS